MGILGKIFGAPDVIKEGMGLLDKAFYTEQEKSEDAKAFELAARKQAAEQTIKYMEATSGQNLARRYLAFAIVAVYLGVLVLGFAMDFAASFVSDDTVRASLQAAADSGHGILGELKVQFGLIMAFYFSSPLIKTVMDGRKGGKE